ncbi:VOC family protein [Sphingosinicella terrae]|uniref:VOC family protein n=1 Tax=Sphingosinicella terrae TaxID=2172047 RepID=UPI000E0CEBD2|nr:VOC family protein [Sphingosinicella terrae]
MNAAREPIAFIATAKPAEALAFYRDVLGLALIEDSPFALIFSDGGLMLRIQKLPEHAPAGHTVHGWKVADIDREVSALTAQGVRFNHYPRLVQSELGVWTSPDGHKVAWFTDPDGNNLSLSQFSPG